MKEKLSSITKVLVGHGFKFKVKFSSGNVQLFDLGDFEELRELFHCPSNIYSEIEWENKNEKD